MKSTNKLTAMAIVAVVSFTSCSTNTQQKAELEPTAAQQLIDKLECISRDSCVVFGHHDDTAYGVTWNNIGIAEHNDLDTTGRSDVKDVVGDYPGLMNWDLGRIEFDSDKELDGVPFDFIRNEIRKQHKRGGINSISFHVSNPLTIGNSWDTTSVDVEKNVVNLMQSATEQGTEVNKRLCSWIEKAANFIASLTDENGKPIPVVFRPWHEHTGSWFWWGAAHSTPENYKQLWKLTRAIFDKHNITNVVWCYSPDRCETAEKYLECYPGDEYVDIMGADVYMFGAEDGIEWYTNSARQTLTAAANYAKQHNKLVAFSETGSETIPVPDFFNNILLPICKEFNTCYVCVWRNATPWMKENHYYAPYKGHASEASFIQFYNNPSTLFCNETAKY